MCSNATVSFAQQFRLHNPSDASPQSTKMFRKKQRPFRRLPFGAIWKIACPVSISNMSLCSVCFSSTKRSAKRGIAEQRTGVKDMKIERYCPVWSWRRCRYSPLKRTFVPWAKGKEMEQRA